MEYLPKDIILDCIGRYSTYKDLKKLYSLDQECFDISKSIYYKNLIEQKYKKVYKDAEVSLHSMITGFFF